MAGRNKPTEIERLHVVNRFRTDSMKLRRASSNRKTRHRFENPGKARYLTCSCFQRLPLFGNDAIKAAFVDQLILLQHRMPFDLFAWVLMPEHVHLLVVPRDALTIPDMLLALKRPFAARILARWRTLQAPILYRLRDSEGAAHFWQAGGGHDRNVAASQELEAKVHYTHNNPIRRGLVNLATQWKWSSARWYEGDRGWGPRIDPLPL